MSPTDVVSAFPSAPLRAGRRTFLRIQLLGPYSRFGWSHPGPAYFYLALPFYEAFGERGPALNVFALVVDGLAALAIVLTARRLRGGLFALVVALYARPKQTVEKSIRLATAGVLVVFWSLPLYQAISERPGNIQQLIAFFAPRHLSEHPWGVAVRTIFEQMAVMPLALARTFHPAVPAPGWPVVLALAVAQLFVVAVALAVAVRRGDRGLAVLATIVLVQCGVAMFAVRAIRGDIEFYLVAWAPLIGFLSFVVLAAWLIPILQRSLGAVGARAIVVVGVVALLALAVSEPVTRGPVFRRPDADAERLARAVESYLRSASVNHPTIRVASDESWPIAVAVVLYLNKQRIPISVETRWLSVVGNGFTAPPGTHPELLFGDRAFDERARTRTDLTFVAAAGDAYVYGGRGN